MKNQALAGSLLTLIAALSVTELISAGPAEAQFFHRNSDGQQLIDPLLCLSDHQIRQAIAGRGFTNIFLNAPIETHIQVRATRGGTVYLIDFNRCNGTVAGIRRLRAAH